VIAAGLLHCVRNDNLAMTLPNKFDSRWVSSLNPTYFSDTLSSALLNACLLPADDGKIESAAFNPPIGSIRQMVVQKLTVELPEPVFQLLSHLAEITQQSPEQLAAQSIAGNLPPSFEDAPSEMHAELFTMQKHKVEELLQVAHSQMPPSQQARLIELLEKNGEGKISPEEAKELKDLRFTADRLMLRKAYAWALLRWRGHPIPSLDELPLE